MNRIILIGNGFDLAHGLPTSYADFIRGYYIIQKLRLLEGENELNDGLYSVKISNPEDRKLMEKFRWQLSNNMFRYVNNVGETTLTEQYNTFFNDRSKYESRFFEAINKAVEAKNWVDIEWEYYAWLKQIFQQDKCGYTSPDQLNDELELVKGYLAGYLMSVQKERITPELMKECIRTAIYEPFDFQDTSVSGQDIFEKFLQHRWNSFSLKPEHDVARAFFARQYSYDCADMESSIKEYRASVGDFSMHLSNIKSRPSVVPPCYLLPDRILLLNFNYTRTAGLYVPEGSDFEINHIHGELDNEKNPIIFGYGDELDEDYKEIAKLNDNDYLKNIKSIRYLETDNYRKLLSYIDSAPFQIYIMGHSCGNSDRTLLNTLFEHKNCVSIKPFYHQKDDGSDNYIEIVQNISRNFNSMQLMRDRIVNKSYCRPLVPAGC